MAQINFDASQVAPATGELEPIPTGWYNAIMEHSDMKPTKDAATTGNAFLECRYNIIDGKYAGRKLFDRFNLRNSNPVAQEIAYKELSAVCHATGRLQVADSQMLHGIPMKIKVKVKAAEGQYAANNEVVAYRPVTFVPDDSAAGVAPGAPVAAVAPQAAWAPSSTNAGPQGGWNPNPAAPMAAAPAQPPQQAWAPPAAAPVQAPAGAAPWAQAPQQPWGTPPAAAQAAAPVSAAPPLPPGANPQGAVPPWQQR